MDSLKCEKCKTREATHHEANRSEDGKSWVDVHLCDRCIGEVASLLPNPAALIQTFLESEVAAAGAVQDPAACPDCGITYPEFRARGRLGCPRDYEFFATELGPLMASIHQGGTQHRGKAPSRRKSESPPPPPEAVAPPSPPAPEPEDAATVLRRSLDRAVAEERYEDAAALRDQLGALISSAAPVTESGESPPVPPPARKRAPRKRKARPAPETPPPDDAAPGEGAP